MALKILEGKMLWSVVGHNSYYKAVVKITKPFCPKMLKLMLQTVLCLLSSKEQHLAEIKLLENFQTCCSTLKRKKKLPIMLSQEGGKFLLVFLFSVSLPLLEI